MDIDQMIFYFLYGFVLAAGLLILFTKNIVRAVFLLMLVFVGVAIIYFISGAEFVGVTQIMIYVGGILILMMFGVMLTSRIDGSMLIAENKRLFSGFLLGIGTFSSIAYAVNNQNGFFNKEAILSTTTEQIGVSLMTEHILALELIAILLLVALVGASFIAGTKGDNGQ